MTEVFPFVQTFSQSSGTMPSNSVTAPDVVKSVQFARLVVGVVARVGLYPGALAARHGAGGVKLS